MINWEEIKHIHVVKKLEEILGQWFNADILFLDEHGEIKNKQKIEGVRKFKNPILEGFFENEKGKALLLRYFSEANEKAFKSQSAHFTLLGPVGFETILVSRIYLENEFLGSILAYSYLEQEVSLEMQNKAKQALIDMGFSSEKIHSAFSFFQVLHAEKKQYFYELVDLMAQEVVTFHGEITKREQRIHALTQQLENRYRYDSMIGKSKPMQDLYSLLDKIHHSESIVLIQGENGTGKELIAKAIHFNSIRKDSDFITVNCSAFNENLLDSELFGHVKGSFTGAVKDKKGLFELADKGTLFLDEIGDMPLSMQVKLLRVLQEGTFTPVGGVEQKKIDVRVLAATNKDLKEMIEDGSFREDLYYRINVINLVVPPLRDRKEDIILLVEYFISRGCKEKNIPIKVLSKGALEKILNYSFPGNIRELENEIERLIVLSGEELRIPAELLSPRMRDFTERLKFQGLRVSGRLKDSIEELEKTMIREGLKRTSWNKSRLAKELGISRAGLIMKVEKYQLDKRKIPRAGNSEAA